MIDVRRVRSNVPGHGVLRASADGSWACECGWAPRLGEVVFRAWDLHLIAVRGRLDPIKEPEAEGRHHATGSTEASGGDVREVR